METARHQKMDPSVEVLVGNTTLPRLSTSSTVNSQGVVSAKTSRLQQRASSSRPATNVDDSTSWSARLSEPKRNNRMYSLEGPPTVARPQPDGANPPSARGERSSEVGSKSMSLKKIKLLREQLASITTPSVQRLHFDDATDNSDAVAKVTGTDHRDKSTCRHEEFDGDREFLRCEDQRPRRQSPPVMTVSSALVALSSMDVGAPAKPPKNEVKLFSSALDQHRRDRFRLFVDDEKGAVAEDSPEWNIEGDRHNRPSTVKGQQPPAKGSSVFPSDHPWSQMIPHRIQSLAAGGYPEALKHLRTEGVNLTAKVFEEKLQASSSTTVKAMMENFAVTMDEMLNQAMNDDKYLSTLKGSSRELRSGGGRVAPPSQSKGPHRGDHNPRRQPSSEHRRPPPTSTPPLTSDSNYLSERVDSPSLVSNHVLAGQAKKVDNECFILAQQRVANVLFSGWREIVRQTREHCTERAVLLDKLRELFQSLLENAHDAATYYLGMYQDIANLRLDETAKTLQSQLIEKDEEIKRLREKIDTLEADVATFEPTRAEYNRLVQRQEGIDEFLREQLNRNNALMKMASLAAGGVIPPHVVAAMTATSAMGRQSLQRRSTKNRQSVNNAGGSILLSDGEVPLKIPSDGSFIMHSRQDSTTGSEGIPVPSFGDFNPMVLEGENGEAESPFTVFASVDANTQTTLDDAVDAQLMSESNAFFAEVDRAAGYSQVLCRIVYGTTDFYNPSECADNARRLLEEISARAVQLKEATLAAAEGTSSSPNAKNKGGATSHNSSSADLNGGQAPAAAAGQLSTTVGGPGSPQKFNYATLMGYFDMNKQKVIKLLQFGSSAAREMRLRFASMADNEAFRRAVEWRPPRGPKDPCRLCNRSALSPEELSAITELVEAKESIKKLDAEKEDLRREIEKMQKMVEHERQVAHARADDLEAIMRVRKTMLSVHTQTEVVLKFGAGVQVDLGQNANMMIVTAHQPSVSRSQVAEDFKAFDEDFPDASNSLVTTPVSNKVAPAAFSESPYASNAQSEWKVNDLDGNRSGDVNSSTFLTVDKTFITAGIPVARRRSSVSMEVTFDPEVLKSGAGVGIVVSPHTPSKPPQPQPVQQRGGSGSRDVTPVGHLPPPRRQSEFSATASRYREAFVSLDRRPTFAVPALNLDALMPNVSPKSQAWTIRMIAAVYRSRYQHGQSDRSSTPETAYTCSKHFTDFLRQNFGTKSLLDENASAFLKSVHQFAGADPRIALFARQFADEFHREVYRHFLTFGALIDSSITQFDTSAASKKGDELADPSAVSLECLLYCIQTLYTYNDRVQNREELCHVLATKAIQMSTKVRGGSARKASVMTVRNISAPGTPIEASDSLMKYRNSLKVQIPADTSDRVVLRVAFLTFLCETLLPYLLHITAKDDTPLSGYASRVGSVQEQPL